MVVDTSALVAILFDETDAEAYEAAIENDVTRLISAASVLETAIVVDKRFGEAGGRELDLLLNEAKIKVTPVDLNQLDWARFAYRTYGRGRHAANLNFGDCFSYALAKWSGEPLLYKGNDFTQTDVARCALTFEGDS